MQYVLITDQGKVAGWQDCDPSTWSYPEGWTLVQSDFAFDSEKDPEGWTWDGETFTWKEPPPPALDPAQVIKAIYTAMPALTVGLIDALAVRMRPYLPDYDSSETYAIGCVCIKDGKVQRRTIGGWREL